MSSSSSSSIALALFLIGGGALYYFSKQASVTDGRQPPPLLEPEFAQGPLLPKGDPIPELPPYEGANIGIVSNVVAGQVTKIPEGPSTGYSHKSTWLQAVLKGRPSPFMSLS